MWKVYGDSFMIATRLDQPAPSQDRQRATRVRHPGWFARAWRRLL